MTLSGPAPASSASPGLRAPLMLAHAAYAALMAGLPCDGPLWTALVAERDRGDPLIEISYLFHEICHFRDPETHAWRLRELIAAPPPGCRSFWKRRGWARERALPPQDS